MLEWNNSTIFLFVCFTVYDTWIHMNTSNNTLNIIVIILWCTKIWQKILCYPANYTFLSQYSLKIYTDTEAATNCLIIFLDFCFVYHDKSSLTSFQLKSNRVIILCLIKALKQSSMPGRLHTDHNKTEGVALAFAWVIYEGGGELIPVICGGDRATNRPQTQ